MAAMPDPLCVTTVRLLGNVYMCVSMLCVHSAELSYFMLAEQWKWHSVGCFEIFPVFHMQGQLALSNLVQSLPSVPACLAFDLFYGFQLVD